ncbi:uncharacterized protein LOC134202799 [Armigeres subalbatus]|uniref:uncharacterized protein LOC134202799 n=1 Tax=Armigeres subalbatus TaxID=124917 RepID=UPI002ED46229
MSWAILCSGGTYTQAKELFSFLNMPFMSRDAFAKDEIAMDSVLQVALDESLDRAVEAEKAAVLEEMAQKGTTPPTEKYVKSCAALDGSWGQRSNGHRYNSASGCAAIIATRTKKVCYVGCKNKRCIACNINMTRVKNNQPIREHKCYRNYKGASGGMEPAIIIDGFEVLRHKGLKFTTVVTDGDSTTVARLKNSCKYGPEIRHQLCCNHVMKNLGKKLREARNKPGYCRRKVTQCIEVEHDYGEEAVTAMEESEDVTHDCTTIESKYKVTEATREQLSSSTSITDMEEITMGRILTKFVPEIIGCKESNKWKKCDMILQATTTWNYLKSKRAIVGLVLRSLKEQHGVNMGECKMFVDTCHQYLCCVADAISEDGTTVLLIKKHDTKETVLKTIQKCSNKFGCRMKDGKLVIGKNLNIEVQSLLHTAKIKKCLICFVNGSDHMDNIQSMVEYDDDFFQKHVVEKIAEFFKLFLSKKVVENAIDIKC